MRDRLFVTAMILYVSLSFASVFTLQNEYLFFAGFSVLQLIIVSVGWNIMGGFCGYINFGTPGFIALGAYVGMLAGHFFGAPISVQLLTGALAGGALGFFTGYMTLRLKGIYFAIGTLSIAVILETVVSNLDFIGGARGMIVERPAALAIFPTYTRYLFFVMTLLTAGAIILSRYIQFSWIGRAMRAIRDNEEAAEGLGAPTLSVKLLAATVSGALLGVAGVPLPILMSFIEPTSLFNLNYAILAMAMPLVGGTFHWIGPVIGGVVLGVLQQVVSVIISSEVNVLLTGLVLILSVVLVPKGILGLFPKPKSRAAAQSSKSTVFSQ